MAVALLQLSDRVSAFLGSLDLSGPMKTALGAGGYDLLGVACFTLMALVLFRVAKKPLQV